MARMKEYDRGEVLDAATRIFWVKGFKGTSMSDLVAATGLNKHSMYQEFGSKEGLFRECIDNYFLRALKDVTGILTEHPLGLQNIEDYFRMVVDHASSNESSGCMMVNSAIEKELLEEKAFIQVKKNLVQYEELLYQCLAAAQKSGDIAPRKDCRTLADFLLTFGYGMMVKSKTGPSKKSLEALVEIALSIIKN
jgi:TetR/AcrR family transcriptional regulator, transcriptional repressor for nem operon